MDNITILVKLDHYTCGGGPGTVMEVVQNYKAGMIKIPGQKINPVVPDPNYRIWKGWPGISVGDRVSLGNGPDSAEATPQPQVKMMAKMTPLARTQIKESAQNLSELRDIASSVLRSNEPWHSEGGRVWCGDVVVLDAEDHVCEYLVALHNNAPDLFCVAVESR